jgi:hypothetical protein
VVPLAAATAVPVVLVLLDEPHAAASVATTVIRPSDASTWYACLRGDRSGRLLRSEMLDITRSSLLYLARPFGHLRHDLHGGFSAK